ncbi:MAG: hypothetical protein Q9161_001220 [Pseudevernia consocians]
MTTSQINDEAELDFLAYKITAVFLGKENFYAYEINIVNVSEQFVEANVRTKQGVTCEDIEYYRWLAVRTIYVADDSPNGTHNEVMDARTEPAVSDMPSERIRK